MLIPFYALSIVMQLAVAVTEPVPDFDVEPTCLAAARAVPEQRRDIVDCIAQERGARDELEKKWAQFAASDRDRCAGVARIAREPSYVELLTCLDIARSAQGLPDERNGLTTGEGE